MSIKCDSYISKLCNLTHTHTHTQTHTRLEAVNSSRISTVRFYPEYKSVILKVMSPIPAGLLRSPSFSASSHLLSFLCGNGTRNRNREEQMLRKISFYLRVLEIKKYSLFVSANCYEQLWGSGIRPARIFIRNLDTKWMLVIWNNLPDWCNWVFISVLSARHVSGLYAHLQEQWMLQFL